jgi:DNA-directed RNA polymerase subunit RPC12/RpoP
MAVDVVIAVLATLLGLVTLVALALGLLGVAGLVRLVSCENCGHLVVLSRDASGPTCPYCRHHHLAHPLRMMRHPVRELARH